MKYLDGKERLLYIQAGSAGVLKTLKK